MRTQARWWSVAAVCLLAVCRGGSGQRCVPLVTCPALLRDPAAHLVNSPARCSLPDGSNGVKCPGSAETPVGREIRVKQTGGYSYPAPSKSVKQTGGYSYPAPTERYEAPPSPPTVRAAGASPLPARLTRPEEVILRPLDQNEEDRLVCSADVQFSSNTVQALVLAVQGDNVAAANSGEELQLFFSRPSSKTSLARGNVGEKSAILLQKLGQAGAVFSGRFLQPPLANHQHFRLPDPPAFLLQQLSFQPVPNCTKAVQPQCGADSNLFRTHDGTCNSELDARLGSAHTAYERFFPSAYDDGLHAPRSRGVAGGELPSPRLVSLDVGETNTATSFDLFRTIGLTLFGQFVDHDLTSTPEFALESTSDDETEGEGGGFNCCHANHSFPEEPLHPIACIPIRVPDSDLVLRQQNVFCLNQVRSLSLPDPDCVSRPVAQQNQITHFLDGSNIYGSSDDESRNLRLFSGGQLRTTDPGDLLPRNEKRCASHPDDCFISGDHRAGENIGLAFIHLIWTREHNRVVTELAARHPGYDDERLYQEARRIVIAEYQHIVYNEFLPAVLGYEYTADSGLIAGTDGGYDPARRPVIYSEFSTAAFRFGHSMIHDVFELQSRVLRLERTFFNSSFLHEVGLVRELAVSLTSQRPGWVDRMFSDAIRHRLFAPIGMPGMDLIALNINRGRDHGLQPYVTAVENCHNRSISSWEDFEGLLEPDCIARLSSVYDSYEDVDLYIGLVSELRAKDAGVGPTLQCLIGQQFANLRHGDRFFYDNKGLANSFTGAQLAELKRSSLARIYCDNVPGLRHIQPLAFIQPEFFANGRQSCDVQAVPAVDLSIF